jgi:ABC-type cobalt transport system substrate-binding protein
MIMQVSYLSCIIIVWLLLTYFLFMEIATNYLASSGWLAYLRHESWLFIRGFEIPKNSIESENFSLYAVIGANIIRQYQGVVAILGQTMNIFASFASREITSFVIESVNHPDATLQVEISIFVWHYDVVSFNTL